MLVVSLFRSEQLTNDKREKIAELNRSIATEEERKQIQL